MARSAAAVRIQQRADQGRIMDGDQDKDGDAQCVLGQGQGPGQGGRDCPPVSAHGVYLIISILHCTLLCSVVISSGFANSQ